MLYVNCVLGRELCRNLLENEIAFLTVELAVPNMMRSKREVKSSFADQLAVIGKCSEDVRTSKISLSA